MANLDEIMGRDLAFKGDHVRKANGDLDTISGLENYKQALFHRLITSPGAFVFRPEYGVGIKDFQNSPTTLAMQRQLAIKIKEQYELDPRTEKFLGVAFNVDDLSPEKTLIIVRVKPIGYDEITVKFIPFGGEGIA